MTSKLFTIIGANGFIGNNIANYLEMNGYRVQRINRDLKVLANNKLGNVIYCSGYGDCKSNPNNVVNANVTFLQEVLSKFEYERFLYISSTRVYLDSDDSREDDDLIIRKTDTRKLFNLTKLVSETLLNAYDNVVILRLSNVYGNAFKSDLFLPSIVRDAVKHGVMNIYTSKSYNKDYINVNDVCNLVCDMFDKTELDYNVYNVAAGINVTSEKIVKTIEERLQVNVNWHNITSEDKFPVINIERLQKEFNFKPSDVLKDLELMIHDFKDNYNE